MFWCTFPLNSVVQYTVLSVHEDEMDVCDVLVQKVARDEIYVSVSVIACLCAWTHFSASVGLLVCVQILKVYESTFLSSMGIF